MRARLAIAVCALALLAATVPALAASRGVRLIDNAFAPRALTVEKGTTVVFRNTGRAAHNVVVTRGPQRFSSPVLRPGRSYRRALRRRGTYTVVCTLHSGMRMTVRVR